MRVKFKSRKRVSRSFFKLFILLIIAISSFILVFKIFYNNLDIELDRLVPRLSGRRTCKECGASFHIEYNPPKVEGVCDACGGELYQRPDESEEAVKVRLDTYEKQTRPLIDYYTMKGQITNINGDQSMEDVFKDIKASLGVK